MLAHLPLPFALLSSRKRMFCHVQQMLPRGFYICPPALRYLTTYLTYRQPHLLCQHIKSRPLLLNIITLFKYGIHLPGPTVHQKNNQEKRRKEQKDYILDKRYKRRKHDSFNGLSFLLIQPGFSERTDLNRTYTERLLLSVAGRIFTVRSIFSISVSSLPTSPSHLMEWRHDIHLRERKLPADSLKTSHLRKT